jgi:hypothetical protein
VTVSTVTQPVELHEDLERLALAGEGWTVLLRRLALATSRPARLIGVHGGVLATSRDGDGPALSLPASGHPAPAGTEGVLGDRAVTPLSCTALHVALAALDVLRAQEDAGRG